MKKQKGFTLIELIIVIVILGILAAFIVPRYGALDSAARTAVVNGMQGSLYAAASIAHGLQLANSVATNGTVTMEGNNVTLTYGYPTGNANGILSALNQGGSSVATLTGFAFSGTAPTMCFCPTSMSGCTSSNCTATCSVSYTASSAANTPPTISVTTTGC